MMIDWTNLDLQLLLERLEKRIDTLERWRNTHIREHEWNERK